jgi:hypothetical protein
MLVVMHWLWIPLFSITVLFKMMGKECFYWFGGYFVGLQNDNLYLLRTWCFVSLCTKLTWTISSIAAAVTVHENYCALGSVFKTDCSTGCQMNVWMAFLFPAINRICFAVQFLSRSSENNHTAYIAHNSLHKTYCLILNHEVWYDII